MIQTNIKSQSASDHHLYFYVPALRGVVIDLSKSFVRSVPRDPFPLTAKRHRFQPLITVEVIEPDNQRPLQALSSSLVSSLESRSLYPLSLSYCIAQSIVPHSPEQHVHRLFKEKAAILAKKSSKALNDAVPQDQLT